MHEANNLVLSDDCSQIAFAVGGKVFLYDIIAQEIITKHRVGRTVVDIQFSQDGHWLYVFGIAARFLGTEFHFTKLQMVENGHSVDVTTKILLDEAPWVSHV